MNMVEILFGIVTRQAIRPGTFTSVSDLIGAVRIFIEAYNDRCATLPGPRPQTRSSPRPAVESPQTRDTRHTVHIGCALSVVAAVSYVAVGGRVTPGLLLMGSQRVPL